MKVSNTRSGAHGRPRLNRLSRSMAGGRWAPPSLFRRGEQGAVYDPSNFASLFQDSAGMVPVTAVEQPVGLALDSRFGLVRGPELFDQATAILSAGATRLSPGVFRIVSTGAYESVAPAGITAAVGQLYEITFNVDAVNSGAGLAVDPGNVFVSNTVGPKRVFVWSATVVPFAIKRQAATDTQISGITVRAVPGNHLIQPSSPSRGVTSARLNFNTNFNANPTDLTGMSKTGDAAATLSVVDDMDALVAAGLSGQVSGGQVFKLDNSAGATTADANFVGQSGSAGIFTGSAWVRGGTGSIRSAQGAAAGVTVFAASTAYQRVACVFNVSASRALVARADAGQVLYFILNQLEVGQVATRVQTVMGPAYDPVGFPVGIRVDGIDDGYYTVGAVDFSGTDKVTAVVGIRRLVDDTARVIFELGANSGTDQRSFAMFAPLGASPNASFRSGGTLPGMGNTINTAAAPVPLVLGGYADIAAPIVGLRINGVPTTPNAASQGTGNYANAVLNLLRRNNSALPFSGMFYCAILLGRTATAVETAAADKWTAQRTGISL